MKVSGKLLYTYFKKTKLKTVQYLLKISKIKHILFLTNQFNFTHKLFIKALLNYSFSLVITPLYNINFSNNLTALLFFLRRYIVVFIFNCRVFNRRKIYIHHLLFLL